MITLILIFVNFAPTTHPVHAFDWFINVLYGVSLFVYGIIIVTEIQVVAANPLPYFRIMGAPRFHTFCRLVKAVSFLFVMGFQLHDGTGTSQVTSSEYPSALESPQVHRGVKIPLTVCVLTSWLHCFYYLLGFESTGPFLLVLTRIVVNDLPYFAQFYVFVLMAFGCAISMITNNGNIDVSFGFSRLLETICGLIQKTISISPSDIYPASIVTLDYVSKNLLWVQDILITAYYGVVVLVLVNLLIAIMGTTFGNYSNYNEAYFLMEKYQVIEYLELHMSEDELSLNKASYCKNKVLGKLLGTTDSNAEEDEEEPPPSNAYTFEMRVITEDWLHKANVISKKKTTLFIIDPQIDFHPGGSLGVDGANEDSQRIADMIMKNKHHIHEIFVSLDSHYPSHIAHAMFWIDEKGNHPSPFTPITFQDVKTGKWRPREESEDLMDWCLYYTKALERKGRMTLTIWPEHCIIGSRGHAVVPCINAALQAWALHSKRPVYYVMKGQNCRTEMYSALEAEVPDPLDYTTGLNTDLLSMLRVAERVRSLL
jgi:nicotinamidase-related amidase